MAVADKVVLFVEDNPDDEALTVHELRRLKLANEIVVARDGLEALGYLFGFDRWSGRDTTVQPQVVLLDLRLPKIDGFEVLRQMRLDHRTRSLPVIVLTSSTHEETEIGARELGVVSYLRKPVDIAEFAEAIRRIGLRWVLMDEPASAHRGC